MCFSRRKKSQPPPEETVSKTAYNNFVLAYDVLLEENQRLIGEVADLTGKYSVLGFDEALVRSLAQRAIALLQRVDTRRSGGATFKQEIDVLVGEARSAGVIEEKKEANDASSNS
jgi:hypothetical protein